jgi:acid stress chaperone HdeB
LRRQSGAKPGDIPVEQPTKFDRAVKLVAARALGLEVPRPRRRGDRVKRLRRLRCRWSLKLPLGALLFFGLTPATHAAILDLSMMTCREFLAADKDEIRIILAWLDGYYKDDQDPAILDTDVLVANLKKLNEYCAANPTVGLIIATDRLFGK